MIDALRIAASLNDVFLSIGAQLDRSLRQVDETRPRHEFVACRELVSPLPTTMLLDFMSPLNARRREVRPPAPGHGRPLPASHAAAPPCSALCGRTSLRHATGTSIGA
ncbi:hypothetical protein [Burkholderia sp. AW49-1]